MRLLYLTRGYTGHDARWMRALVAAGCELGYLALRPIDEELLARNHPEVTVLTSPRLTGVGGSAELEASRPSVRAQWELFAPDVVMAGPLTDAGYLATSIDAASTLLVSWAFDVMEEPQRDPEAHIRLTLALKKGDALLADCSAIAVACSRLAGHAFSSLEVMPWGLAREDVVEPVRGLRGALKDESSFVLLNSRGFDPVQQPLVLLEGFRQAQAQRADLRLWLAGKGALRAEAEAFVARSGLTESVRFFGQLNPPELGGCFLEADAYVATSRSDGSSISLLQAMHAGLPCITSDLPGNREWLGEDGGFLTSVGQAEALAEAMVAMAAAPEVQRQQMGALNRRRVSLYAHLPTNLPRLLAQLRAMAVNNAAAAA